MGDLAMGRMTAKEARDTADNSGWLLDDTLAQISDAAKHNGTSLRVDVQRMSQEAIRKAEESLKYLGYTTVITRSANEPDGDAISLEVLW